MEKEISRKDPEKKTSGQEAPLLSLCMIVKDEEENLPRCLQSVRNVVDEIVVVDTGSGDRTVEVARSYGARVFYYPWSGDFSAARNFSLEQARGQWILFLDADEELVKEDGPRLREIIARTEKDGFMLREINFVGERPGEEALLFSTLRLFRNRPEFRFRGKIHEQMLVVIQENRGQVDLAPIRINHYGYLRKIVEQKKKSERNLEIILDSLKENPGDSFMAFNLGMEYIRLNRLEEALESFRRSFLGLKGLELGYAHVLIYNIASVLHRLKRYREALSVIQQAQEAYPDYTDLEYMRGLVLLELGSYTEALQAFQTCLANGESSEQYVSFHGSGSFRAELGLAVCHARLGDRANAVRILTRLLQHEPRFHPALEELGKLLVQGELPKDVISFLKRLILSDDDMALSVLSELAEKWGEAPLALSLVEEAITVRGPVSSLLFRKGEILLGLGDYEAALAVFSSIKPTADLFPLGQLERALTLILAGRPEESLALLRNFASEHGTGLQWIIYYHLVLKVLGEEEKAKEALDEADTKGSMFEGAVWALLLRLLRWRQFVIFEKAVGLLKYFADPRVARRELGKLYYQLGYRESAAEELIQAYHEGSYDAEGLLILGDVAKEKGFVAEAVEFYRASLALEPRRIDVYTRLTSLLGGEGRYEEALDFLRQGLRQLPNSEVLESLYRGLVALSGVSHLAVLTRG